MRVDVKPLSVNEAWQGRRYKTEKYKSYEYAMLYTLPHINIPQGDLRITFEFGFSNKSSDLDNPVKPFLDILQKRYGFNDSRVYEIVIRKKIVKTGSEYIDFDIQKHDQEHTLI